MRSPLIFLSLALTIGIAIGLILQKDPDVPDSMAAQSIDKSTTAVSTPVSAVNSITNRPSTDVTELNQLLQDEITARLALEQKLEVLSKQVAALEKKPASGANSNSSNQANAEIEPDSAENWFNEQALLETGMDSSQASQLRTFFEQLEMEKLYLRDQAIREEWDSQRMREAMLQLNDREENLKIQLGDNSYDAYLYASGQPNRVEVTSVLATAPAGSAGILAGDQIVRYDNQRIYSWADLREATSRGNANETVSVELIRNGKSLQFYLPRGPLGIRMNSVSAAP